MTERTPPVVHVLVQRQPVDEAFVMELVEEEASRLGIHARTTWVDGPDQLLAAARDLAGAGEQLLLVTGPGTADLTGLPSTCWGSAVRVDLALRDTDQTPGLLGHIHGRGVDGLRWALRSVYHRGRRTVLTTAYGPDPDQFGELRLADGSSRLQPVVVLLHGGFWRSRWTLDLMDALAVDLAQRGFASWNLEYRRPDVHRWSDTVDDVLAGIRYVTELAQELPLDAGRLALVGHSAGGQLAAQAARALTLTTGPRPRLVVQLAGLVDLVETHRRDLGNGAVPSALGGTPDEVPSTYDSASPMSHPGIRGDQLVVIGRSDSPDLREMSRRYVRAAQAAGDDATLLEDEGDHFTIIDPASGLWHRAACAIEDALST